MSRRGGARREARPRARGVRSSSAVPRWGPSRKATLQPAGQVGRRRGPPGPRAAERLRVSGRPTPKLGGVVWSDASRGSTSETSAASSPGRPWWSKGRDSGGGAPAGRVLEFSDRMRSVRMTRLAPRWARWGARRTRARACVPFQSSSVVTERDERSFFVEVTWHSFRTRSSGSRTTHPDAGRRGLE